MKFILLSLLVVFASCATFPELETTIDKDKIMECIRGFEPVLYDIIDVYNAFQENQLETKFFSIMLGVISHVKQAIGQCQIKSNEITLEGGPH